MNAVKYLKELPLSQKVLYLIMAVFGCMFYTIVIANHYYFRTYTFDYAAYNFAFWDYAHFHISIDPIYHVYDSRHMTFLQDHFSFTLMYFVPVYWLLNWLTGSYTLLIIQVTLILWSAWALYRLVKLKTNDEWLGVIAVLYYFLLQGRYSSFSLDCNIAIMVCCFVPPFLLYFETRKYATAFIVFILLLFSREDMPLWFIFIFITLGTWHWKDKKIVKYCIGGIIASILYFIMLFKVFIPMCETPESHYFLFQYSALGATPLEALLHILKHPIETFKLLYINPLPDHTFDGVKKEFYMVYLISGAFLLFLRPQYFIWFIPIIAQKMFNDDQVRWGITGYYSIPVVTLLPISIFIIISIFKVKWIRYSLSVIVCVLAFFVTKNKMDIRNRVLIWGNTTKENIFDPKFFHPDYDAAKINDALKLIPPDAKVCASEYILPHLAQRKYPYDFPDVEDADYIAVFTFKNSFLFDEDSYSKELYKYVYSPYWETIAYYPPFILLKKTAGGVQKSFMVDSIECSADTLSSDKLHFVASNDELVDNADTRDTLVKHNGNYSIRLNKNKQFGFTYHSMNFKNGELLKITVWKYPVYEDTGKLVISGGNNFYETSSVVKNKLSSGWGQIEMYVTVPNVNSEFRIYVMNDTQADVWFDDLKIVRHSFK